MTLLAHWKIDDGRDITAPAAVDSAAGGSGAHDGSYSFSSYDKLYPFGVGSVHMFVANNGYISSIANPADLRLIGSLTLLLWVAPDEYYGWVAGGTRKLISCSATDNATEATNNPFNLYTQIANPRQVIFHWQHTASNTDIYVTSAVILPIAGWCHLAVVRYEISSGFFGVKFYVDGVLADTQDNGGPGYAAPTGGGSALPYIGRDNAGISGTDFMYDSVRIYDTEESDANILAVYNAEKLDVFPDVYLLDDPRFEVGIGGDAYRGIEEGPHSKKEGAGWTS